MRCQIAKRLSLGLEEAPFFCRDTGALAAAQATSWTRHLEIPTTIKEWRMGASGPLAPGKKRKLEWIIQVA